VFEELAAIPPDSASIDVGGYGLLDFFTDPV
jgi:hypothetical protein